MEFIQDIKFVAIKPQKIRAVVRQIKHWPVIATQERLNLIDQSVGPILVKGIGAAIDRIKNLNGDPKDFIIKRINCNESIRLKRRIYESRGRARKFSHQRSHIQIFIGQKRVEEKASDNKKEKIADPKLKN